MLLISEPEAATIYTTRYLTEEMGRNFLKASNSNSPLKLLRMAYAIHRLVRVLYCVRLAEKWWFVIQFS